MRQKPTVLLFESPVGIEFDCIVTVREVKDKRHLTKTNKSWVKKSECRKIIIDIQGIIHRFLVAFNDIVQYNKFMFSYKYSTEIDLQQYDFVVYA